MRAARLLPTRLLIPRHPADFRRHLARPRPAGARAHAGRRELRGAPRPPPHPRAPRRQAVAAPADASAAKPSRRSRDGYEPSRDGHETVTRRSRDGHETVAKRSRDASGSRRRGASISLAPCRHPPPSLFTPAPSLPRPLPPPPPPFSPAPRLLLLLPCPCDHATGHVAAA